MRSRLAHWSSARALAMGIAAVSTPILPLAVAASLFPFGRPFPGLLVMERGVVLAAGLESWTGRSGGIPLNAVLLAADHRPVREPRDVYDYAATLPVGTPIHYDVIRGDEVLTRDVPTMSFGG